MKLNTMLVAVVVLGVGPASSARAKDWRVHDMQRPRPAVVTPADSPGGPPSDAIVLFDGTDLSGWLSARDAGAAPWKVGDGYFEVEPGTGGIRTRESFGDCQLHIEWATPPAESEGQGRGNSGLFFMGRYEVQVLDSYENDTYPDGQAAAAYAQQPPEVNASRPPRTWQTYDVVFRRPRFDADGTLVTPARVTVFHNGVLVQDGTEFTGPTDWLRRRPYRAHADALPIELQDHGNRMRFRNVWLRALPDPRPQPKPVMAPPAPPSEEGLARYAGKWGDFEVVEATGRLWLYFGDGPVTRLRRSGTASFEGETLGVALAFGAEDAQGRPSTLALTIGRSTRELERDE